MKKIFLSLFCVLILSTTTMAIEFSDVKPEDWHYPHITTMATLELVQGFDDGLFYPDKNLNMAEFSALLSNGFYGTTRYMLQEKGFSLWWETSLYATYLRGGLVGTPLGTEIQEYWDKNLRFNRWENYIYVPLSRFEMVTMVANLLVDQYIPLCTQEEVVDILRNVPDVAEDSPYAIALASALKYGIVHGDDTGLFRGEDILTRAQGAVVINALVKSERVSLERMVDGYATLASPEYNVSSYDITGNLDIENYVFARVNELRAALGLSILESVDKLVDYSNIRAQEAEINWAHTRPDGTSWSTVFSPEDTENRLAAENLTTGKGFYPFEYPDMIFKSWLNSPSHYAAMIGANHETLGIAVYVNESGAYYATQIFGNYVNN